MDVFSSERALAFGEPPVYSSRDFVTVQTSERPSEPGLWHKSGSRFSIALRNIAQNEMIDTNSVSLQFSVAVVVLSGVPSLALFRARSQALDSSRSAAVMVNRKK